MFGETIQSFWCTPIKPVLKPDSDLSSVQWPAVLPLCLVHSGSDFGRDPPHLSGEGHRAGEVKFGACFLKGSESSVLRAVQRQQVAVSGGCYLDAKPQVFSACTALQAGQLEISYKQK